MAVVVRTPRRKSVKQGVRMGNTQPTNRTGKKVTAQKLENAKKLGVLSLSEHGLDNIPPQLYAEDFRKLRTLDLSANQIGSTGRLSLLAELKALNLDKNALCAGSLSEITRLAKLQSFSCANNMLGAVPRAKGPATNPPSRSEISLKLSVPPLPTALKQLNLSGNLLTMIPFQVVAPGLVKLEKLDLSHNEIASIPPAISRLTGLRELILDKNFVSALPESMGEMKQLKSLSLRQNRFKVKSTVFSKTNPQPIPAKLFTDTPLIDLNLHGNAMTNTQLNQFEGFQAFLERRQKVKSKTMTNLDVCGLD